MYICKPERNVTQVKLILFISVIVTALLFLVASFDTPIKSFVNLAAFAALVIAILVNVRYSLTEFEYTVGNGDFSVTKTVGNRRQVVCCVALSTAIELIPKRDYDHLPSTEKGIIKYSLNQNMKAESFVFLCDFNGKRAMIEFEPNKEFVAILTDEIAKAKHSSDVEE